jgi:hypothetical protein
MLSIVTRPQYFLTIPFPTRITIAVGRPLPSGPANDHPSKEQVDKLHNDYLEELQRLYEEHKEIAGYADTPFVLQR